ncbi:MAG: hypothetical protein HY040_10165 [Planctomycetes bacterium]|nr:hypothetical protein [Planctomycetota bacterium]
MAEHQTCGPQPKWAAQIEDQHVPAPQRTVKVKVLKDQANIASENILVRDHGGDHDVPLDDEQVIDLAQGNVFYAVPACEAPNPPACHATPKLAFFVDDRPEVTFRADQNGTTLRELFGFTPEVRLFRDYESPHDQPIGLDGPVNFGDGPVFYTRRKHAKLTIAVNDKPFTEADGVKHEMSGRDIAKLVFDDPENYDLFALPSEDQIGLDQTVKVKDCDKFKAIRKTVAGGYEITRIDRELDTLRQGGAKVTFVPEVPAVVFHDIPARKGYPHLQSTDVLVTVPGGYPGQALDGAYLPQGSPLLGKVVGSPQGNTIQALNRTWQLVSYHPHAGGGAPPWNKDKHGFHTYVDELLTWVHRANQ